MLHVIVHGSVFGQNFKVFRKMFPGRGKTSRGRAHDSTVSTRW